MSDRSISEYIIKNDMVNAGEWFDVKILILDDIHIVMINDILKLITRFDGFKHCRFHDKPLEEFRLDQLNNEDIIKNLEQMEILMEDLSEKNCKSKGIQKCNKKECKCLETLIGKTGLDKYCNTDDKILYDVDQMATHNDE